MKHKKGIFMAVAGIACILLSKSSIFQVEIHPGLGIKEEPVAITFLIFAIGITFLLVGTYQFTHGKYDD